MRSMTSYDAQYGTLYPAATDENGKHRPWERNDGYAGVVVNTPKVKASAPAEADEAEAVARQLIHEKTGEALEEIQVNLQRLPTMH